MNIQKSSQILLDLERRNRLPEMPETLSQFEAEWHNPNKHINELSRIVEQDKAISRRILNVANSILYRGDNEVKVVAQAVTRLGMIETRNIVHAFSLHSTFTSALINPRQFWRHSIHAAFAAKRLADYLNQEKSWSVNPANAFLAGLLHDAGSILMARHYMRQYEIVKEESTSLDQFIDNESRLLHMNHAILGAALFKTWKFPEEVIMAIAGHHHPERIPEKYYPIAYVTSLSEAASWLHGDSNGFFKPTEPITDSQFILTNLERENLSLSFLTDLSSLAANDSESCSMLSIF